MDIDRKLRYEAATNLGQTENIRHALLWISRNPEGFSQRVEEFEDTIKYMNRLLNGGSFDTGRFGNVSVFQTLYMRGDTVVTPSELAGMHDMWQKSGEYEETGQSIRTFFPKLHDVIASKHWGFPTSITDNPNKLATGLLIEGYGLFLEDYYGEPGFARKFVLAFEEVLVSRFPDSALLSDVIDWMVEEKEDFSPHAKAEIEEVSKPKTELQKAILRINSVFKRGGYAYEVLDELRMLPKPIAVDFNNVLVNGGHPLKLNPDASAFLQQLGEIGNIVIVTAASGWEPIQAFLQEQGLWNGDMVLMTSKTYEFMSQWEAHHPKAKLLRKEFTEMSDKIGRTFDERDLVQPPAAKVVAPIFGKPFDMPIIDDAEFATERNPGMLGITVKAWTDNKEEAEWYEKRNVGKATLSEAVEIARRHYKTIQSP